jgi:hypothetical protein
MMKPELSSSPETLSQCDAWILLIAVSTSLRQFQDYCFFHLVPFDHWIE